MVQETGGIKIIFFFEFFQKGRGCFFVKKRPLFYSRIAVEVLLYRLGSLLKKAILARIGAAFSFLSMAVEILFLDGFGIKSSISKVPGTFNFAKKYSLPGKNIRP